MDAPGIEARGLWLRRGGREVLRGVSLAIPSGLVTVVSAPSGAGKSTLLRCLNRLLEPDAGEVLLNGRDVRELEPRVLRRRVGLVAQAPVMLPGSVRDNVLYSLPGGPPPAAITASGSRRWPRRRRQPDAIEDDASEDRLVRALDAAGLDAGFADRVARELSGGERARVALARAVARDPEVLLLDEPTAALDHETAERVAATLRDLASAAIAVCLATHDLALAEAIADRIVRPFAAQPGAAQPG
jgi:ABC-type multidrug transport system fused ATPase/permease subunit